MLSTLFLNRGLIPLGTVVAGFGTDLFGARITLATMAVALLVLTLLVSRRTLARPRRAVEAPARA